MSGAGDEPTGNALPLVPMLDASLATLALSLLSAIGEGVGLATRGGRIIWDNAMLAGLSSAMRERISTQCRQFDKDHPLTPKSVKVPKGWLPPRSEQVLAEEDKFFELVVTPVSRATLDAIGPDVESWAECLVLVVRDVSAARRLQHRINAIDQAGSELLRFDTELMRKLNAVERLKHLEDKIVRFCRDLLHFDHFAIRLLDKATGKLELVLGCGLPSDYDSFAIRPALEGNGITGYVAASGRSYICTDTQGDKLYLPGVNDAKSSLTVPLRLQDQIIGVLNVESVQSKAFGDEERQLCEIFARYIAVSIHMLDLLVVERVTTNQAISGRVALELKEPLEDIAHEVEAMLIELGNQPAATPHLERINRDLVSIRARLQQCAAGPAGLLGVEQALHVHAVDPLIAGKRVLIADDESKIRTIIGKVLEQRGGVVVVVDSGERAIEALAAGDGEFDLVISDIRMPGANGYEVFSAAKKRKASLPVILMTGFGYDPSHSIVRASQEGLQRVLYKPFQVERLMDEVKKALA
jgi:CheY-like chemotaxis protein